MSATVSSTLWESIGGQLRHPAGLAGDLTGYLMRYLNAQPNRLAIRVLRIEAGHDVLELGCGPGHALALMAARTVHGTVHGIDQSDTMLAQARRRNRRAILAGRVRLHPARFDKLPLADGSIDRILGVNVAYFWDDPAAILEEARRVLRPDGMLAVYVTDASAMRHWKFASDRTHRLFDRDSLREVLRTGGFDDEAIDIAEIPVGPGLPGLIATARK